MLHKMTRVNPWLYSIGEAITRSVPSLAESAESAKLYGGNQVSRYIVEDDA